MIQHLVSRGLLRRFANHRRGPISGIDLVSLEQRTDKVERFGGVEDTDLLAPNDFENIWNQEVETPLPYALKLLDEGSLLSNPRAIVTIKNCIALHWSRGFAARETLNRILIPNSAHEVMTAVLEQYTLPQVSYALTGSHSTDRQVLYDIVRTEFAEKLRLERYIDDAFLNLYRKGQVFLESKSLEVWHSQNAEFLLGDIPVVSYEKGTGKVGILEDVPWNKADAIFMPLGPHHVVAISRVPAYKVADARMVERLNVYQARAALKEVYFRPGSGIGDIIGNALH